MRITKQWVRGIKIRIDQRIKDVFQLNDEELKRMLHNLFPIAVPGTREENIQSILRLSLDEIIPIDAMF